MSTAGDLVNRCLLEYLALTDDRPAAARLNTTVNTSVTSVVYVQPADVEDENLFRDGGVVELDSELMFVTAVDTTTNTLTVVRGFGGTTAAAHTAGALIYPDPVYPRKVVFDAVADNVVALYPTLWWQTSTALTLHASNTWSEVPATVENTREFIYTSGGYIYTAAADLLINLPAAISSTGKAVKVSGPAKGTAGTLIYRARFARPSSEATDLAAVGVDAAWDRIVVVGAAAQVIAGRDLDSVSQEYLSEQMRAQGFPVGSSSRIRNELLRYRQLLLDEARRQLLAGQSETVEVVMPAFSTWTT